MEGFFPPARLLHGSFMMTGRSLVIKKAAKLLAIATVHSSRPPRTKVGSLSSFAL